VNEINKGKIYWGVLEQEGKLIEEVEKSLKEHAVRSNQPPEDVGRILEYSKRMNPTANENSPDRDRIPLPASKKSDVLVELKKLHDTRHRIPLGSSQLPSICCYTFYNTNDGLNDISFSPDSTLMSCGYSDSYIEVCCLTSRKLRGLKSSVEIGTLNNTELLDLDALKETEGSDVKRLVGHSGPVYSTSFTTDNRFLLSSSQDGTARLWSLDTYTNLVCYKGHNYPVWDVDIGSLGLYFATASNDRTARLWSFEHIQPLRIFAGHLSDVDVRKNEKTLN
jgi:transcription initiation factor TFIID subunit 5